MATPQAGTPAEPVAGSAQAFATAAPPTAQIMMTLAGLAATGATPRPYGESQADQATRIANGIAVQLEDTTLVTGGAWTLAWLGLTNDQANLAFIACNSGSTPPQIAVCLRGSDFSSIIDLTEDMDVEALLPFPPGASGANISQGAMQAFTETLMGTGLLPALNASLCTYPGATVTVLGHSLGGALATTVGMYLAAYLNPAPTLQVYTFAAPTAGDAGFAQAFNTQFPSAQCYVNQYDVIPYAWANLTGTGSAEHLYDSLMSGIVGGEVKGEIDYLFTVVNALRGKNTYVQPTQQAPLNANFSTREPGLTSITSVQEWMAEMAYQHANNTYLSLLGAATLDPLPAIGSISPASGPPAGGTIVTISAPPGQTFTVFAPPADYFEVDFGVVPAQTAILSADASQIMAVSPPGAGTVDIRVTTNLGTSPVVSAVQFFYVSPS
jgi:hypothetical protein